MISQIVKTIVPLPCHARDISGRREVIGHRAFGQVDPIQSTIRRHIMHSWTPELTKYLIPANRGIFLPKGTIWECSWVDLSVGLVAGGQSMGPGAFLRTWALLLSNLG